MSPRGTLPFRRAAEREGGGRKNFIQVPYYNTIPAYFLMLRIRDPVPFFPLDPDPGSGIGFSGSRIPTPYFLELSDKFLGKKFYNSLKTGPNYLLPHLKNKIIFNFVATKKGLTTNFFSPLSFVAVFGSGIRDPRSGIRDPGSGMVKNQDPG